MMEEPAHNRNGLSGAVSRRSFVLGGVGGSAALAGAGFGSARAASKISKPNILFIMADDLGYADLSCYGRRDYATPALDLLAKQGMRFTQAYANSAVCSATRTALITGRYQYRLPVGLEEPLALRDVGLPPHHPTLPSMLRAAGYQTALVGKWHLGALPKYGPLQSGYDHFWGFRGGGVDYFTHDFAGQLDLWDGDHPVDAAGYLTDLLGDRAIEMLGVFSRDPRPFMMSLHFSAPHWPWEGPQDKAEAKRLAAMGPLAQVHLDGGTLATYAAIVQRLDFQIGRVLAALKRLGRERDTIVVFTSDNGGERFSDTWPFSGRKGELLEGGVRVPAIVRWPGRVKAGSESEAQIMSMDWLPTFLAAAGEKPDPAYPSDGVDISQALAGGKLGERPLFWRYKFNDQRSCRSGDWKYLKIRENEFLFNVTADPLERANLKNREPDRFQALRETWSGWNAEMLPIDPASFTHGFSGGDIADRMGLTNPGFPPGRRE